MSTNKVIEFKKKEKGDHEPVDRLHNLTHILEERLENFTGSEKELEQLKVELSSMLAIVNSLISKKQKAS